MPRGLKSACPTGAFSANQRKAINPVIFRVPDRARHPGDELKQPIFAYPANRSDVRSML